MFYFNLSCIQNNYDFCLQFTFKYVVDSVSMPIWFQTIKATQIFNIFLINDISLCKHKTITWQDKCYFRFNTLKRVENNNVFKFGTALVENFPLRTYNHE